jgi:hypothetical protein
VFLREITRHPDGPDLACAKVEHWPPKLMTLADKALRMGASVISWGYPLPRLNIGPDGTKMLLWIHGI